MPYTIDEIRTKAMPIAIPNEEDGVAAYLEKWII